MKKEVFIATGKVVFSEHPHETWGDIWGTGQEVEMWSDKEGPKIYFDKMWMALWIKTPNGWQLIQRSYANHPIKIEYTVNSATKTVTYHIHNKYGETHKIKYA